MGAKSWLKRVRSKDPSMDKMMGIAGLYSDPNDPSGIMRIEQGGNREGQYNGFPICAIFPNMIDYQFKSANDVETTNLWAQTAVGSGTALTVQAGRGGWAKFVNGGTDNDAYDYQAVKAIQTLGAAGKRTWFETEIIVKDVSEADMFVGLCAIIATSTIFDARINSVGFYMTDGSPLLRCETSKTGPLATQASSGITMLDDVSVKVSILCIGTSAVYFFVNNVLVYVSTTNIPSANLSVSFGLRNGTGGANEFSINTIMTPMDR